MVEEGGEGGCIYFIKWQFPDVAQHVLLTGSVPRGRVAPTILRLIEVDDVTCLQQTRRSCRPPEAEASVGKYLSLLF